VPSQQHRPSAASASGREGRERERERENREEGIRSRASMASIVDGGRRLEETVLHRQELEEARKENEALRQRVKELERMLRERREGVTAE